MKLARLSVLRTGRIYSQDISLVPISVRSKFDPRYIVQPEEKQMCIYRNSFRVSANTRKRAYSVVICPSLHAMGTAASDEGLIGEIKRKIEVKTEIFLMKLVVFDWIDLRT